MTTKELQNRVNIRSVGRGNYYVTIMYRRQIYSCHSNNSLAYDRIYEKDDVEARETIDFYTLKGAYMSLYYECRQKNNLN